FTLGASDRLVPANARVIHVEIDPREIGKLRQVDVGMAADPRETLRHMIERGRELEWSDRSAWHERVREAKRSRRERLAQACERSAVPIHPYAAVSTLAENLPPGAFIIGDGAEAYHWMNEVVQQDAPGRYITHGFLGAVGFGLGLAMGVQS